MYSDTSLSLCGRSEVKRHTQSSISGSSSMFLLSEGHSRTPQRSRRFPTERPHLRSSSKILKGQRFFLGGQIWVQSLLGNEMHAKRIQVHTNMFGHNDYRQADHYCRGTGRQTGLIASFSGPQRFTVYIRKRSLQLGEKGKC